MKTSFLVVVKLIVIVVFAFSCYSHFRNQPAFLLSILRYRLTGAFASEYVSIVVPSLQLVICMNLAFQIAQKTTLYWSGLLLFIFTLVQGQAYVRELNIECGCLGALAKNEISLQSILLVGMLSASCVLSAVLCDDLPSDNSRPGASQ